MAGKITELTALGVALQLTDLIDVTIDPAGTPLSRKTTLTQLQTLLRALGNGALLAYTAYNPGTATSTIISVATFADVDATNLTVTFTVPASGNVRIRLEAVAVTEAANSSVRWNLRTTGGADVAGTRRVVTNNADMARFGVTIFITGLTPGASQTYRWGHSASNSANAHTRYGDDGTAMYGPAVMEVWSA